jgi:uncharacterized protein (TIGR03067 family)
MRFLQSLALAVLIPAVLVAHQDSDDAEKAQELMQQGTELQRNGEFKEASEIFRQVVELDETIGAAWHLLGYTLHADGQLDEAIKIHKKAATFAEFREISNYNLGCAYSLKKDPDKAFEYLNKAVEGGYRNKAQFNNDTDLDNIRKDDRYTKLMAKIDDDGKELRPDVDDDSKAPAIVGEWTIKSGVRAGENIPNERLTSVVTVTKETFTIPAGPDKFVMAYTLDASQDPMRVDMEIKSGPVPTGKAVGIIKVDGEGTMTLCYDPMGANRPESFEATADNGCFLFKMEKKADAGAAMVGDWKFVNGKRAGEDVEMERLAQVVNFTKDTIKIPAGEGQFFVMKYTLDATKQPHEIDMKIVEGPAPESEAKGIVKIDGDRFLLCYDPTGQKRPASFESTADNGFFQFEMKKSK